MKNCIDNHQKEYLHDQLSKLKIQHFSSITNHCEAHATITLAASHLDMALLPELYQHLTKIGRVDRLLVVLFTRGGDVDAARRIALLLRDFCQHLTVLCPYYCQSSGTLLALSADKIYYTPISVFSAFDPYLHGGTGDESSSLSSADVKLFSTMAQDWFNCDASDQSNMLGMLCEHIFPPTLTSFYRTVREVEAIAHEHLHLSSHHYEGNEAAIIQHLMFGQYSHEYALTGQQLRDLGLPFAQQDNLNPAALEVGQICHSHIGAGNRVSLEESWCDAIILAEQRISTRWKDMSGLNPQWAIQE